MLILHNGRSSKITNKQIVHMSGLQLSTTFFLVLIDVETKLHFVTFNWSNCWT